MEEIIIHAKWEGPFNLSQVKNFNDIKTDYGIYKVYAHHPIYGGQALVYIGEATERTFSTRIPEHGWEEGSEADPNNVVYYLGRLRGPATPADEQWRKEIAWAEKLLIHAHGPAYNSTHIMSVQEEGDPEVQSVRVLNWGSVRSLLREVSGLMWTKASDRYKDYRTYGDISE